VTTLEIKIVLWYALVLLAALGLASWAQTPRVVTASPSPDEPAETVEPASAMPSMEPVPGSRSPKLTAGPECPVGRVAVVRGSDSEAREGGGFEAARANGIHGAVDLDGYLGEPIFAVRDGKVQVAVESDRGKLGKTVVVDHLDGAYTIYGHLRTVDVKQGSTVTAGEMLGTMGYSGNARRLQEKNLPPHLHFAYVRGPVPFARIRESAEGLGASVARNNAIAEMTGPLHPLRAVGFRKCWEDPTPATRRPTVAMP
jgi:murein DD-endopeptidase MepM/ murein hydrolase activator NlpD